MSTFIKPHVEVLDPVEASAIADQKRNVKYNGSAKDFKTLYLNHVGEIVYEEARTLSKIKQMADRSKKK